MQRQPGVQLHVLGQSLEGRDMHALQVRCVLCGRGCPDAPPHTRACLRGCCHGRQALPRGGSMRRQACTTPLAADTTLPPRTPRASARRA
jgi:hypothetical protein